MSECLTHFHSDNDEDDDSQARLPLEAIVLVNIMAPLAMKPTSFHALFCNSDQRFYLHHFIVIFSLILILHNEKFYKEDKSKILLLLATLISIVVPCIYSIVIMMWII